MANYTSTLAPEDIDGVKPVSEYSGYTVTLTDAASAPRRLRLRYGVCLPCRAAVSRCDGHDNYTKACIQCSKRNVSCIWSCASHAVDATPGASQSSSRAASLAGTSEESTDQFSSDLDERLSNGAGDSEVSQKVTAESQASHSGEHRQRFRFPLNDAEDKGLSRKQDVPSAGWPDDDEFTIESSNRRAHDVRKDLKGKGRMIESSSVSAVGDSVAGVAAHGGQDAGDEDRVDNDTQLDQGLFGQLLRQLGQSAKGVDFRDISSYRSLLASQFAEDSSNLARSLYWWEFSREAKEKVRARFPPFQELDITQWEAMSLLDKLLAENTYAWALWPRRQAEETMPDDSEQNAQNDDGSGSLPHHSELFHKPGNKPFLTEQLVALVSQVLQTSTLPDDILQHTSPTHLQALAQIERNYGFPASFRNARDWRYTPFHSSKFAIPQADVEGFSSRFLDREDLVLDIVDHIGYSTATLVKHTLDSVLLKIAQFRQPKGMRRLPVSRVNETDRLREVSGGQQNTTAKKGKKRKRDKEATHSELGEAEALTNADLAEQEGHDIDRASAGKERRRGKGQAKPRVPVDWQRVLHVAIHVPGFPRSVLEASIKRLEDLYGPAGMPILQMYDGVRPPQPEETNYDIHSVIQTSLPRMVAKGSEHLDGAVQSQLRRGPEDSN